VGIPQIFVLDPETHVIYGWNKGLVELADLKLTNDVIVAGEAIWQEFDRRMKS
jgi:hypothetical protein